MSQLHLVILDYLLLILLILQLIISIHSFHYDFLLFLHLSIPIIFTILQFTLLNWWSINLITNSSIYILLSLFFFPKFPSPLIKSNYSLLIISLQDWTHLNLHHSTIL